MSDASRTEEIATRYARDTGYKLHDMWSDFAKMERELNAANARIAELESQLDETKKRAWKDNDGEHDCRFFRLMDGSCIACGKQIVKIK